MPFFLFACLAFSLFSLQGCGGSEKKESKKKPPLEEQAQKRKENTLLVYSALKEEADAIKSAYEARFDVPVEIKKFSTGEILYELVSPEEDKKPCVWVGGPSDFFVMARSLGLLKKYVPEPAKDLPPEYLDPKGTWTGIYVGAIGFISNKDTLKKKNLAPPASWKDFLNPALKGEIAMPNPMTSGTGFIILSTLVSALGEEEAFSYLRKLHDNKIQYVKSGGDPGKMTAAGGAVAGIAFAHDLLPHVKKSPSLVVSFPKEGSGYEVGAAALLSGCENEREAKKFLNWLTSENAKTLFSNVNPYRLMLMGATGHFTFPYQGIHLVDIDSEWAGANRTRIIRRWYDEVMKK